MVAVHLKSVDSVLVTGMYLSNPWVRVSPPHYMPTLVLFHCLLNSVSGSPRLRDCLVIARRRLLLSGIQLVMAVIQGDTRKAIICGLREETAPTFKTLLKDLGCGDEGEPLRMDGQH